jgi:CMP-2-keto-3-deoxyoctulosonic acid synthetase
MKKCYALLLVKSDSKRLPNKNQLTFYGEPMWKINTAKCLKIFDKVFVSSDDIELLHEAWKMGAIPIERGEELCGDTPNIPVYQHALERMGDADAIVAVQVNSPTVHPNLIAVVKMLAEMGVHETMTVHKDYSIYGSIWALSAAKLRSYKDPYNPKPWVTLVDNSIDIHTEEDFNEAIRQYALQS